MGKLTDNYVDDKVNHIYFLNDFLIFQFEKSKGI